MNWINKNPGVITFICFLICLVCLIVTFVRVDVIYLTDNSLEWVIGVSISLISIAVTVALATQIYSVFGIDAKLKKVIETEKAEYRKENKEMMEKMQDYSEALNLVQSARSHSMVGDYELYLETMLLSAIKGLDAESFWLVDKSLGEAVKIINDKKIKMDIRKISEERISTVKKRIIEIPDERVCEIINFLNGK